MLHRVSASTVVALIVVLLCSAPVLSNPNEALICLPNNPVLDKYQYLRSLSLSLRGHIPSLEEYDAMDEWDDVPDSIIDEWLDSPAFQKRVAGMHRALLWNRVTLRKPFSHSNRRLTTSKGAPYRMGYTTAVYRGVHGLTCLNEPAEFTESGQLVVTWNEAKGGWQEGYVEVAPYWDMGNPIKVCGFLAQETLVSPSGTDCSSREAVGDPSCGCGPNLRWCHIDEVQQTIMDSVGKAVDVMLEAIVAENRPYTDLFLASKRYINGPIAHMWKHLVNFPANNTSSNHMLPAAVDPQLIPDLDYTDTDTWVELEFPPEHAGVLTSPAFLLRFTTNRRRARRFYEALLCQPFMPPKEGLDLDKKTALEPNLQERDGCKYCHTGLDPAAAHWARWAEYSAGYLSPQEFPAFSQECNNCIELGGCSIDCKRHYLLGAVTKKEKTFLGWLKSYVFLKEEHKTNPLYGPTLLVEKTIVDGRLPRCASTNFTQWLLRRELTPYELDWREELSNEFVMSNFNIKALVKTIVTHPYYRRAQ